MYSGPWIIRPPVRPKFGPGYGGDRVVQCNHNPVERGRAGRDRVRAKPRAVQTPTLDSQLL
jgi:hypothetical protein